MWQKARVLVNESTPWWTGREIWTEGIPYLSTTLFNPVEGEDSAPGVVIRTNLMGSDNFLMRVRIDDIELLGGEDAFCENPPMVPYEKWSKEV